MIEAASYLIDPPHRVAPEVQTRSRTNPDPLNSIRWDTAEMIGERFAHMVYGLFRRKYIRFGSGLLMILALTLPVVATPAGDMPSTPSQIPTASPTPEITPTPTLTPNFP